jgi:hypothetical protein
VITNSPLIEAKNHPDLPEACRYLASTGLPRGKTLLPGGLCLALLFDGRLGRSETRDRHAIRRAAHVGQANAMAELDGIGVAAVFAADAELDARRVFLPFSAAICTSWPTPVWSWTRTDSSS